MPGLLRFINRGSLTAALAWLAGCAAPAASSRVMAAADAPSSAVFSATDAEPGAADDSAALLSLYLRARVAAGLGQRETARDLLIEAARIAPAAAPIQLALAEAHRALGEEAPAEQALDRALVLAPDEPRANLLRVRDDLRQHRLEKGLTRLLKLAGSDSPPLEVYELLHPLLLWSGDAARGAALFDRARTLLPAHAFVHEACADFLACLGREEEALDGYRRALALDPRRDSAARKAARLLEEQGDRILRQLASPVGAGVGFPAAQGAARDAD
jgi:tetratricopeptide (TPR) repeat protein